MIQFTLWMANSAPGVGERNDDADAPTTSPTPPQGRAAGCRWSDVGPGWRAGPGPDDFVPRSRGRTGSSVFSKFVDPSRAMPIAVGTGT